MTAIVLLLLVLGGVVGATVLWVRSERGWLPGAGAWDALGEVAVRLFPRVTASRDRLRGRLWAAVRGQVSIDVGGKGLTPSTVRIRMAPADYEALGSLADWVSKDLAERLVLLAGRNGWVVPARPLVVLQVDEGRAPGRPVASSDFAAASQLEARKEPVASTTQTSSSARLIGIDATPTFALSGDGPFTIGRDRGCELTVPDDLVSRTHVRLRRLDEGWEATDLQSTNGVRVNDVLQPGPAVLRNGDVLRLSSRTAFRCHFPAEPLHPQYGRASDGPTAAPDPRGT